MKKFACLVLSVAMIMSAFPLSACAVDQAALDSFMTTLDHVAKMNEWKAELNTWFANYKTRIMKGETLSLSEMNVVFAYVDLNIDMTQIYLAESSVLSDNADGESISELREIVDNLKVFYEKGLINQVKYFDSVSSIFERLVSK